MWSKILLSSLIYSLIGALMLIQTNIVLAIASDPDNPITAAITSAITGGDPTPSPTATPSPSPSATPTPTPTPHPETNFVAVNLIPATESPTPNGNGTLTVTLTSRTPSGSVGVIERGYVSGTFSNLIPNSLYTIWFVHNNFLGYDPVRSDQMRSDNNGNINFFTADFNFYHRTDQQIEMVNIALRSKDLLSNSESCSKYTPCLYSAITFPTVTSAPTPQPTPSATPQASASATPSTQPISSPIIDDSPNCINFWIFSICLPDFTPIPISTPTPTTTSAPTSPPTATPSAIPSPTATPSTQPISSPITDDSSNCLNFWIFSICLPDFISPPTPTPVPTPTATPQPVSSVAQQIKTWMLIYRPQGSFYNILNDDPAIFTKNTLLPTINEATRNHLNYTLSDEDIHYEYNPPPQKSNAHSGSYDYAQLFQKYDLCNIARQKDIKAVILWADGSGEYTGGMWESAVTGSKGVPTNGGYLPYCNDKTIVVYGLNYTRGLAEGLESYSHHLERVFGKFRGEYGSWSDRGSCGNNHNPPNSRFEYDRENTASFQSDCRNFQADGTGVKESLTCNVWGCTGDGWLKFWMQSMPADWWTLVGNPDGNATPTPVVTPVITSLFPNPANWGTVISVSGSNLTNSTQIYINNSLVPSSFYKPVSENHNSISFILPAFTDFQAGQTYKLYVVSDAVKSNGVDLSVAPSVRQDLATPNVNQVLIDPQVNLDSDHPEVLLAYSNFNVNLSIPKSVTNPTLNFGNILVTSVASKQATFNNILNINANTDLGTVKVEIPTSTTISGPLSWTGVINAPQIKSNSTVTLPVESGKLLTTSAVLEVGAGDTPLTFDKAVRLLIPSQAGKLTGFQRGSVFTKITNNCSADTQAAADSLPAEAECYISVGNDLVIWTKHFTKFVTYTQTLIQSQSNSSNPSSSSNPSNPPVCTDAKPASAPKLLSAKTSGRNQVSLTWSKAADPVTYYLVAYGTKPGILEYGNPNIGGKETTSYIVESLQNGQTYYFKVRAGNHCAPGEFSNELAVKAAGDNIVGPARGFKSGVLSIQNQTASADADLKFQPITEAKPQRAVVEVGNLLTKILNFLHDTLVVWLPI